ncbi:hypothetical protein CCAX7_62420 [Capsulimonas corticalis]|uniref:Uncharacterized protein n=1 Tax=Capsulimonas corticalis TaxID=2219043 RepID=A0A402CWP8_9BACT|nr:glycosyltransferase [Capsulimonas corticalis]BDI34191.1 hypothetical protein CCAX7_62420 [Capsulimonas corticalis]
MTRTILTGNDPELVRLGIVAAVRNCLQYTQEMVASIRTRHTHQIYIIDDRSDEPMKQWLKSRPDFVSITDPPESTGVAYNWNVGIAAAIVDGCSHVLVANNDIIFHPRTIDVMVERISRGDAAIVTAHDVGGTYRDPNQVIALPVGIDGEDGRPEFFCFALTRDTLKQVGWFDDNFEGAYYEDNDYHARVALARLRAVRLINAPCFHHGTATIRDDPRASEEIGQAASRNKEYFAAKWGRLPAGSEEEMRRTYFPVPFNRERPPRDSAQARVDELFERVVRIPSDINGHLELLMRLGASVDRITEISPGGSCSTCAFLKSRPRSLRVYEPARSAHLTLLAGAARIAGTEFEWIRSDASKPIAETDLLFIDTTHVESRMREDLRLHAGQAQRYIVLHDTQTYGHIGETAGHRGVWPAVSEFLRGHPEWLLHQHYPHNNGLTVLRRTSPTGAREETA